MDIKEYIKRTNEIIDFLKGKITLKKEDWEVFRDKLSELILFETKIKSPWISVEDRLPENGSYMACLKNRSVMQATFTRIGEDRWFVVGVGSIHEDNPVTHWQPLPNPPEK